MTGDFDYAFTKVIGVEGGYVRNPDDPGGETKYGISKRSYPALNIPSLTLDDAKAIYRRDYWDRAWCSQLPAPLALLVFDCAVNSGSKQAVQWLQQAVGTDADGRIGDVTMQAVAAKPVALVAAEMTARRMVALAGLPTWAKFNLGWARRMAGMLGEALVLAQPAASTISISPLSDEEMIKRAVRAVFDERKAA